MSSLKDIRASLESHYSLKGLVEVYEEISANTMRHIRVSILRTRDYYVGLSRLSSEVGTDFTVLSDQSSSKSALVFLSANDNLYGDIIDKVFVNFLAATKKLPNYDVFVVGASGTSLMNILAPNVKIISVASDTDITKLLYKYHQVQLFFGQFESLARQEPVTRTLSVNLLEGHHSHETNVALQLKYIYEPSVKQVAQVFAQEIFHGLFQQSCQEHELAKHASRLMHLDQALTNIDRRLGVDAKKYELLKKRNSNKNQHLQLSGYKAVKNIRGNYV